MAMTDKEKAAVAAKKATAAKAEKVRVAALSDAEKAAEKATKLAARPVLTITISKGEIELLTVSTQKRSDARACALLAKENDLTCTVTAEVKARSVVFKGI